MRRLILRALCVCFGFGIVLFLPARSAEASVATVVTVADTVRHAESEGVRSIADVFAYLSEHANDYTNAPECAISFSADLFNRGRTRIEITVNGPALEVPVIPGVRIVLNAPGESYLLFNGDGAHRAIHVPKGASLRLRHFAFYDCQADQAGVSAETRTFDGGAILNDGELYMSDGLFFGNSSGGASRLNGAPSGQGGAVANRGKAVFEQCCFRSNRAANGGAIANLSGGRLTLAACAFDGNQALAGNSTIGNTGGNGGAIAALSGYGESSVCDTLLVNCTLTGNRADANGGGLYANGGDGRETVRLVNTVSTGNAGTCDLYMLKGGRCGLVASAFASRNYEPQADDAIWIDERILANVGPSDVFALVSEDGTQAIPAVSAYHITKKFASFPLLKGKTYPSVCVRRSDDWSDVVYADTLDASAWNPLRVTGDLPARKLAKLSFFDRDQLNSKFTTSYFSSVNSFRARETGPDVPATDDVRVIKSLDETEIRKSLTAALANASALAHNGVLEISFDPSVTGGTVRVSAPLAEIENLDGVTLVLRGPVTLDAAQASRFFTIGAGCSVEFEDIVFRNGSGADEEDAGGAILGKDCVLVCANCRFESCTASFGGAVCLDGLLASACFEGCAFEGNTGDTGADLYYDSLDVRLLDTDILVGGVYGRLVAGIDSGEGMRDCYSLLSEAIAALQRNDILYLLSSDVEGTFDPDDLPSGVTVLHRYARLINGEAVVEGGGDVLEAGLAFALQNGVSTLRLMPGRYAPVVIPAEATNLLVAGTSAASCVIDAGLSEGDEARCLDIAAAGVVLSNLTFAGGHAFGDGGGVRGAAEVYGCVFDACSAKGSGGGLVGDRSTVVRCSLFKNCTAGLGDAVSGVVAYSCTFVRENGVETSGTADASSMLYGCLSAGCATTGGISDTYESDDPEGDFRAWGSDYTLRLEVLSKYRADSLCETARKGQWTDLNGNPLVLQIAGRACLFAGALAAEAPDRTLQDLVDAAAPDSVVEVQAGRYGPVCVGADKGALTVRPLPGAVATIDGCGIVSAVTLSGKGLVEGFRIVNGFNATGGGVTGSAGATVRGCVLVGNRATQSGGGAYGVTVENCTFVSNAAPVGAATDSAHAYACLGVTGTQDFANGADADVVDCLTADEGDFVDAARGNYALPEARWDDFLVTDSAYLARAYEGVYEDVERRPFVRSVAGVRRCVAGAFPLDYNDAIQRAVDAASPGDVLEIADGAYAPFVVPAFKSGILIRHAGAPDACVVDGRGRWRGAWIMGEKVTLSGLAFRRCAAGEGEAGGGVLAGESGQMVPWRDALTVTNGLFTECSAAVGGAGAGKIAFVDCVFERNTSDREAGAVWATEGARVTGCRFFNNAATGLNAVGGAVSAARASVAGCLFRGNSASAGGALAAADDAEILACTFAGNVALGTAYEKSASGAYAKDATPVLDDCVFWTDGWFGFDPGEANVRFDDDPFANPVRGDWRVRYALWQEAVDGSAGASARQARLKELGWTASIVTVGSVESLFAGAYGIESDTGLQARIDAASAGETVSVERGNYLPVVIPSGKDGLVLAAEDGAAIDGGGLFRCVTVDSPGVVLRGFSFSNGQSESSGGAVGGSCPVAAVVGCSFAGCRSAASGGAVAGVVRIDGCRFLDNSAAGTGGAVDGLEGLCTGSLFVRNVAGVSDGALAAKDDARVFNCTFAQNAEGSERRPAPHDRPETWLYNLVLEEEDVFVDAGSDDWHLTRDASHRLFVTDETFATNALAEAWLDAGGNVLAQVAGDTAVMTYGCYADWDMTLQALVDGARMGGRVEVAAGTYPPLFVGSDKQTLTIAAADGAEVVIDGAGALRCVTDASADLTLEGLVLTNGFATAYAAPDSNGGGLRGSTTHVSNCVIRACRASAGGGVYGAKRISASTVADNAAENSGGGAAAVARIQTTLFRSNVAGSSEKQGVGGGVYGVLREGTPTVANCTFVDNATVPEDLGGSGLFGGYDRHNLYCGCRASNVEDSESLDCSTNAFADFAAGDYRVVASLVAATGIDGSDAQKAKSEDWRSPAGEPLVSTLLDFSFMPPGAYPYAFDNRLQALVDAAEPGETVVVPAGRFAPVEISVPGLTLVASEPGACVISGEKVYRGVSVLASDVTLVGLVFEDCDMTLFKGNGGAVLGDGATTVASNCTFASCRAVNGGATANLALVSGCRYDGCAALASGGGSFGDAAVRASLFEGNEAAVSGAAACGGALFSCTLVSNGLAAAGTDALADASSVHSVFVANAGETPADNLETNVGFFVTGTRRPTVEAAASNLVADAAYVASAADWTGPDGRPLVSDGAMTVGAFAPYAIPDELPPVSARSVFRVSRASGADETYDSQQDALSALASGGRMTVASLAAGSVAGETADDVTEALVRLQSGFLAAARETVRDRPWYTVSSDGLGVDVSLNAQATPVVDASSELEFAADAGEVRLVPSNVKPGLWYAIGVSDSSDGPFAARDGSWVRSDAEGRLSAPLTAPMSGASGFYKVLVSDRVAGE